MYEILCVLIVVELLFDYEVLGINGYFGMRMRTLGHTTKRSCICTRH
ncbi:hypothetical protein UFOVP276_242 [uncultured Caudovirales phage]|uniref:Uncharacterized protein n=1 Tax=uncultured Caudovirales phage TaxID=2100421 RepID=A0A6J5LBP3_9CAUD|nr:hypothetical protein UFOVP127_136 [uncultured Caudovirales phage]CAB4135286.1 hypothetical protein UFOVP276_242 [uncultured Caudovirales phage]